MKDQAVRASDRAAALTASRRADTARRRQRVLDALHLAAAHGRDVSVSGIARLARVHRTFIYRHQDLLERIRAMESTEENGGI